MAISETLGIRPWEQRTMLSVAEFEAACAYIDEMRKQLNKGR